jgi:hypothetical protein
MTQPGVFSEPFAYWVGMDTDPRTTPEALAEFNRFYSATHVHEVIAAHPGFVSVSRWELVESDARDGRLPGPRWLAVYAMQDEAAAQQYIKDNARPWLHRRQYSAWPAARKRAKTTWRMLWRLLWTTPATDAAPDGVWLAGMHVPPETDTGFRGSCLELYREFAHPAPGCPPFCAVSAADQPEGGGADVVWRLRYRRIPLDAGQLL